MSYHHLNLDLENYWHSEGRSANISLDRHVYRYDETLLISGNLVNHYNHTAISSNHKDLTVKFDIRYEDG